MLQVRERSVPDPRIAEHPSRLRRFSSWLLSPDSRALVYLGLMVIVAGFALIVFAWTKISATVSVGLQLPYFASGGLVGLGLIVVGVATLSIGAKRRDAFARLRQIQKLATTMESIAAVVVDSPGGDEREGQSDEG